jgi:signal peptidase I
VNTSRSNFLNLSREILKRGALLRFQVPGDSMHPFIQDGDVLMVEPANIAKVGVGEVILYYRADKRLIAHRIIRINRQGESTVLTTQGDSLDRADPPIQPEQVLGKVIMIERNSRRLRLDRGLMRLSGRLWAIFPQMRRYWRPVLRPGWRLCQRFCTE